MSADRRRYQSYLLRLWSMRSERGRDWQASLESPTTGKRLGFQTMGAMGQADVSGVECLAPQHHPVTEYEENQKGVPTVNIRPAIQKLVVVAGLCVAVLSSAQISYARVRGPRLDSLTAYCGALQDRADALLSEYAKKGMNGEFPSARQDEIMSELGNIARAWDQTCKRTFGSIVDPRSRTNSLTISEAAHLRPHSTVVGPNAVNR
jgi:hypothetical protein